MTSLIFTFQLLCLSNPTLHSFQWRVVIWMLLAHGPWWGACWNSRGSPNSQTLQTEVQTLAVKPDFLTSFIYICTEGLTCVLLKSFLQSYMVGMNTIVKHHYKSSLHSENRRHNIESLDAKGLLGTLNEKVTYVTCYWKPEYKCETDQDLCRGGEGWYLSSILMKMDIMSTLRVVPSSLSLWSNYICIFTGGNTLHCGGSFPGFSSLEGEPFCLRSSISPYPGG